MISTSGKALVAVGVGAGVAALETGAGEGKSGEPDPAGSGVFLHAAQVRTMNTMTRFTVLAV